MISARKRIRVAIVGAGYIANLAHLPVWRRTKNSEVVAICDINQERALSLASKFKVPRIYNEVARMLNQENIDLVDICTPPATHASLASHCLAEGYSCTIEKPLAVTVSEVDDLLSISRRTGAQIFVLHTYSYLPCARRVKALFDSGHLGEVVRVETRYYANLQQERYTNKEHWIHDLPGDIFSSELTPHLLMLVLELLGGFNSIKLTTTKDLTGSYARAPEMQIVLSNGSSFGVIGVSFNSKTGIHALEAIGTKGYVFSDFLTQATIFHRFDGKTQGIVGRGSWAATDILTRITDLARVSIGTVSGHYGLASDGHRFLFSRAVQSLIQGTEYPVRLELAREVVRAMETIFFETSFAAKDPTVGNRFDNHHR